MGNGKDRAVNSSQLLRSTVQKTGKLVLCNKPTVYPLLCIHMRWQKLPFLIDSIFQTPAPILGPPPGSPSRPLPPWRVPHPGCWCCTGAFTRNRRPGAFTLTGHVSPCAGAGVGAGPCSPSSARARILQESSLQRKGKLILLTGHCDISY